MLVCGGVVDPRWTVALEGRGEIRRIQDVADECCQRDVWLQLPKHQFEIVQVALGPLE